MSFIAGLLDLLFPSLPACPFCGFPQGQGSLCKGCLERFQEYRQEPVCFRCGRYFQQQAVVKSMLVMDEAVFCRDCSQGKRHFYVAKAAGPYENELKDAVQKLKYTGRKGLAEHLAGLMYQTLENDWRFFAAQVIAAVPLSPKRLRQRGFNQSDLLAYRLAEKMKISWLPILKKTRETPPQAGLNRAEREENLRDAFQLTEPAVVKGKTILLVDDVITTGFTLNSVSETLIRGGAATVICIAAAAGRTAVEANRETLPLNVTKSV